MKIIFLIDSVFSERDYDRFGLQAMFDHDIEVELWDLYKLRNNTLNLNRIKKDINNVRLSRHIFRSFAELNKESNKLDGVFLIDKRSGFYKKHTTCWFQERGAIIVRLEQGLMPLLTWTPTVLDRLIILRNNYIKNGFKANFLVLLWRFKFFLLHPLNQSNKKCFDIRVTSGSAIQASHQEFEIKSHSWDYDLYLQCRDYKKNNDFEYAVFLDNGMVDHPDYQEHGIQPYCTSEVYYPLLRNFFDKFEKETGIPIMISIHPRLIIDDALIDSFGGRKLTNRKSAELVKDSKFVLAHDSTAISFAALWKVPLIIITTNQIERSIYSSMEAITQVLQTSRVNIDNSFTDIDYIKNAHNLVSRYDNYVGKFIKSKGSSFDNSVNILIKGLKEYVQ